MVLAEFFTEEKNKLSGAELAIKAMRHEIMTDMIKDKKLYHLEVVKLCRVVYIHRKGLIIQVVLAT